MKNKNVVKRIAPEQLQGLLLDYANVLCAEELRSMRGVSSYKEHSKKAYEEYRCWFDALSGRVENIKAGKILRVLKFVGAYDGLLFRLTLNHRFGVREPPFRPNRAAPQKSSKSL